MPPLPFSEKSPSLGYKHEHELFVTNLKGTSFLCLILCLAHLPVCYLIIKLVQWNRKPHWIRDYAFFVVPLLLSITVLHNHSHWSLPCLLSLGLVASKLQRGHGTTNLNENIIQTEHEGILGPKKVYLTVFKGANMLLTCLSILAVDFKVFPRRFAKTDVFGVGLMDIGIGTFIVASAFTSKFARGIGETKVALSSFIDGHRLIVLLLGLGRLIAVKSISYHEKVSEYGTHWNFFISLYCIWMVSDVIHRFLPRIVVFILACLWLYAYQFVLINTDLTDYIISAPRLDFISANREGILSLNGLIPLFLLSELYAHVFFFTEQKHEDRDPQPAHTLLEDEGASSTPKNLTPRPSLGDPDSPVVERVGSRWASLFQPPIKRLVIHLSLSFTVLLCLWIISTSVQPTSRRLANVPYVLLILTISVFMILTTLVAEVIGGLGVKVLTVQHFSDLQMPIFLVANVFTGLVNLSIKTIHSSAQIAMLTLLLYAAFLTGVSWTMARIIRLRKPTSATTTASATAVAS